MSHQERGSRLSYRYKRGDTEEIAGMFSLRPTNETCPYVLKTGPDAGTVCGAVVMTGETCTVHKLAAAMDAQKRNAARRSEIRRAKRAGAAV